MGNKRIEKKKAKMKEIRAMKKTLRETDIPKAHLEILSNSGKGSAESSSIDQKKIRKTSFHVTIWKKIPLLNLPKKRWEQNH